MVRPTDQERPAIKDSSTRSQEKGVHHAGPTRGSTRAGQEAVGKERGRSLCWEGTGEAG